MVISRKVSTFWCGKVMLGEPSRIRTQPRSICIMTGSSLDPMQYSCFEKGLKKGNSGSSGICSRDGLLAGLRAIVFLTGEEEF